MRSVVTAVAVVAMVTGCGRLDGIGQPPPFSDSASGAEFGAMATRAFPEVAGPQRRVDQSSLWASGRASLLGDRRARTVGDILTVVIQINESARISNQSDRSRSGSEEMAVPNLFGLPQRLERLLPEGQTFDPAVDLNSSSSSRGSGSVRRNEQLTLRIAATVTGTLPNGVLEIRGTQEVRVNYELRELLVTGYVRPEDISRQNEVTYDKIASARISYGGRGQISEVQQPRYGQQAAERLLPF
ncbi:MAG: flagellar basal body L-ring protein FlgH [Rhodobacteraceae bacterium]|jgi:flagellar L-ring protein precursor FlgH|nr:flagellar basal body L-ring protein FlgH [Paracoccaceae bacterium]